MDEKDKRGENFTKNEIDLLIDVTLKYKNIVENKRTTWKDKNAVRIKISNEFNATSGSFFLVSNDIVRKILCYPIFGNYPVYLLLYMVFFPQIKHHHRQIQTYR